MLLLGPTRCDSVPDNRLRWRVSDVCRCFDENCGASRTEYPLVAHEAEKTPHEPGFVIVVNGMPFPRLRWPATDSATTVLSGEDCVILCASDVENGFESLYTGCFLAAFLGTPGPLPACQLMTTQPEPVTCL